MSKGLPTNSVALGAIVAMKRAGFGLVTVTSQEAFGKPDADFRDALRSGQILSQGGFEQVRDIAFGATLDEMASALTMLYAILALTFSPEQNQRLMLEEFRIIGHRAEKELHSRPQSAGPPTDLFNGPPTDIYLQGLVDI